MTRLPPFDSTSRKFAEAFRFHLTAKVRSEGLAAEIRSATVHEGRSHAIHRSDGSRDETDFKPITTEASLSDHDVDQIKLADIIHMRDEMAAELRRKQEELTISLMHEVTQRTGQVVDGKGGPLTHKMMIEAFSRMPAAFDPVTKMSNLAIVVHPDQLSRLRRLENNYQSDKELQNLVEELESKKRDEYRTGEMDRVLVG